MGELRKYKVSFSGFMYVLADTEAEARKKWADDNGTYTEWWDEEIEEVEDFTVEV